MSMTESAANIAICNLALGLLGAKSITLNGSSQNHTYCTLFFDDSRDEILAQHRWNWANKIAYSVQTTNPLFGYDYAYTVPSDCIRIFTIDDDPDAKWKRQGTTIHTDEGELPKDYSDDGVAYLEGEYVTSDLTGSDLTYSVDTAFTSSDETTDLGTYCTALAANYRILKTDYVYQVTDVSTYPQYMRKCLVWNLAIYLAGPIINDESSSITLNLQTALFGGPKNHGYLTIAKAADAQEAGGTFIKTSTLTSARQGSRYWNLTTGHTG